MDVEDEDEDATKKTVAPQEVHDDGSPQPEKLTKDKVENAPTI